MILHDVPQNTDAWFALRAGKVTASGVGGVITPKTLKASSGLDYLNTLVAETILGKPLNTFAGSPVTDRGHDMEADARAMLSLTLDADIEEVGFISSDDGRCGASPDGKLVGIKEGTETKVPMAKAMVGYALDPDSLYAKYRLQVQFSLWVTGWDAWHLYAFSEVLPSVYRRVEPDSDVFDAFNAHIPPFLARIDAAVKAIRETDQYADMDETSRAAAIAFDL